MQNNKTFYKNVDNNFRNCVALYIILLFNLKILFFVEVRTLYTYLNTYLKKVQILRMNRSYTDSKNDYDKGNKDDC